MSEIRKRFIYKIQFLRIHREIARRLHTKSGSAAAARSSHRTHNFISESLIELVQFGLHCGYMSLTERQRSPLRICELIAGFWAREKARTTGITLARVVGAGWGGETGEVALLEYRDAPVQGSLVVATGGGGDATAPGARYLEAPIIQVSQLRTRPSTTALPVNGSMNSDPPAEVVDCDAWYRDAPTGTLACPGNYVPYDWSVPVNGSEDGSPVAPIVVPAVLFSIKRTTSSR